MKYIYSLLILGLIVSGCSSSRDLSPEKQVGLIHKQNLQYIIDGNAKGIASAYSENYRDMGGGPNGDGTTNLHETKYWKSIFSEGAFSDIGPIEEVVNLSRVRIYTYPDVDEKYSNFICKNAKITFTCNAGDVFAAFPPVRNSPLHDGWSAVYRKVGNKWKIVAGD